MLLEIKHLCYQATRRTILDNINFQLKKGTVAIVGPSGSGKSTLLKQIDNLISPTSGELLLNDKPFDAYEPEVLRLENKLSDATK